MQKFCAPITPGVRVLISFVAALALVFSGLQPMGLGADARAGGPDSRPSASKILTGDSDHQVVCRNGVVVSVSGPATDVSLAVLRRGGNAVDAAIATVFALEVAYPLAGNIGGGGFMLIHPAPGKGEPTVINYRESAPAAATPTMFRRDESQFTAKSVAVPGTVRGMELACGRFGTLPWRELIRPAINLARDGFVVDANLAKSLNETLPTALEFAEFQRVYAKPGGGPWKAGDVMRQPDLAGTLERLADGGADAFYSGAISAEIVAEMRRGNGLITARDLAGYRAVERKPLTTRYRGRYDVFVPPPPSAGGTCLLEELNILDNFDLKGWGRRSATTMHVMAEAMRRANYDRARYLGDPDVVEPPGKLLDKGYGRQLAETIDLRKATRSETLSADIPLTHEGESTTHFSVLDRDGMAVANTYTLERRWGSRIVVKNTGILLNNDMRAFNLFPGVTNRKGEVGTAPNLIAPGKRPLSSMTPTIVAVNGRVKLVLGSPGSRAIPHTVLNILVGVLDFDEPLREAVESPRFSQEWFPDQITFERPELFPDVMDTLKGLGHTIVRTGPLPQGDAHCIFVSADGEYVGIADHRLSGKAAGF